jgi:hypothetical protein
VSWPCEISGQRIVAGVLAASVWLIGCSSSTDRLPAALLESTTQLVTDRAAVASVQLAPGGAECVARMLTEAESNELAASAASQSDLSQPLAAKLSDSIFHCVDAQALAVSAVRPFALGAGDDSIRCAAERLSADLVRGLVESDLEGLRVPTAQVELELATALGVCLTPAELLNRG